MNYIAYLAGPITGCTFEGASDWRDFARDRLATVGIAGMSPMRGKDYLLTETRLMDVYDKHVLSQGRGIMTRDYNDCQRADVLIVNFVGADRVSIGTCMEIAWAYARKVPVIAIIEEKGNIHDHAMIREAIGFRVTTVEEAIQVADVVLNPLPSYQTVEQQKANQATSADIMRQVVEKFKDNLANG